MVPAASGCGGSTGAAPTSYKTWNATDGTFSIKYPEDWKAEGGGKHGVQWAEFTKGNAKIKVDVSTVSSLLGDIARSAGTAAGVGSPFSGIDPEVEEKMAPVAVAHNFAKEFAEDAYARYQEEEAQLVQCGLGDARKSEFTASGGLGGKLHGYRATALSTNKGVHVTCICSEKNWKTLQPAFDEILNSLGR
jgi:hypothetical protein